MNEEEFAELSAGHALDALSPEDERAFREALIAHPQWSPVADLDEATAAALAEGAGSVAPPVDVRSRLLSAIATTPQGADAETPGDAAVPIEAPGNEESHEDAARSVDEAPPAPSTEMLQTAQRRSWSRGLFALTASIVLLVGIGWGVGSISRLWQTPPAVTALAEIEAAPDAASASTDFDGGTATAHWSVELGKTVLVTAGLPAIEDDRTFEMWLVRGDAAPLPAGTFESGDGDSVAMLDAPIQPGDTIAVTVEQDGGSPTGAPTTEPILVVPTA